MKIIGTVTKPSEANLIDGDDDVVFSAQAPFSLDEEIGEHPHEIFFGIVKLALWLQDNDLEDFADKHFAPTIDWMLDDSIITVDYKIGDDCVSITVTANADYDEYSILHADILDTFDLEVANS